MKCYNLECCVDLFIYLVFIVYSFDMLRLECLIYVNKFFFIVVIKYILVVFWLIMWCLFKEEKGYMKFNCYKWLVRFKCDNDIFYSFFLVVVKNIGIDKFDLMNVGIFKNMRLKKFDVCIC